jgi:hypothetical protein
MRGIITRHTLPLNLFRRRAFMKTFASILVIPRQIPLESYQSLAGLPVSSLPDGVSLSCLDLAFTV